MGYSDVGDIVIFRQYLKLVAWFVTLVTNMDVADILLMTDIFDHYRKFRRNFSTESFYRLHSSPTSM